MFEIVYRLFNTETNEFYRSKKKSIWFKQPTQKYLHIPDETWSKLEIVTFEMKPTNVQTLQISTKWINIKGMGGISFRELFTPIGYDEEGFYKLEAVGKVLSIKNDLVTIMFYDHKYLDNKGVVQIVGNIRQTKEGEKSITGINLFLPNGEFI